MSRIFMLENLKTKPIDQRLYRQRAMKTIRPEAPRRGKKHVLDVSML